jgi:hypothetical protein
MGPFFLFILFCNSRPSKKKSGRIRWIGDRRHEEKIKEKRNGVVLKGRGEVGVVARLFFNFLRIYFVHMRAASIDWLEEGTIPLHLHLHTFSFFLGF